MSRLRAGRSQPCSRPGCSVGQICATARRPSEPCSRRLRLVSRAAVLADALFAAETERAFADAGHSLDFINKAFECLDLIGWEHAPALLPTVVGQMVAARGAEEATAWRQPVDLVALCAEAASQCRNCSLPAAVRTAGRTTRCSRESCSVIMRPASLTRSRWRSAQAPLLLTLADHSFMARRSGWRVSAMPTNTADWETAHHVFTYANAVHQMLTRIGTVNTDGYVTGVRGVLHGAMALYLTRYLNVPPARVPCEDGQRLDDLPANAEMILQAPVLRMSNG